MAPLDAVVRSIGNHALDICLDCQERIQARLVGDVILGDRTLVDIHLRINRQVQLAPQRAARLAAVLLPMPFTGPAKAHAAAVDDQTDRLACGQAIGHTVVALFDVKLERAKSLAQKPEAGHRDVETTQRPEFAHVAGDLPHAPADQPVEDEDQFKVCWG
nr:hypothetical protein [Paraburkholderia sp. NMBU_R16]